MTKHLISVIIPAYNHAMYVGSTINSIMAQDYANIELIIIDDGSKDNTLEVIESMRAGCEKRFSRFYVETQQNQGTCATLNRLISHAQGEYVLLIASDDELLPGAISAMVKKMEANPEAGLVVGRNTIMDGDGRTCYWDEARNNVYDPARAKYLTFSDFLDSNTFPTTHPRWGTYEALIQCNHIPNGYLMRKSILNLLPPFTKDAPLEDWWLMLQISKHSKIISICEETFRYRWHAANTIKQKEKMRDYGERTINWEKEYISKLPDKTWEKIYVGALRWSKFKRFLFQKKLTCSGRFIIKIMRIPVFISFSKKRQANLD